MKRCVLFCAAMFALGGAQAADGLSLGVGVDYSTGDYGSDTTTEILSVPVTAKYVQGNWTFKGTVPWLRVSGDPNVLPGLGSIVNLNPRGRGRGGVLQPGEPEAGTASGIGDVRLSASYAFDTGGPLGIDLTGNAKIATADEDQGLGSGANDYGVALDVYRDFDGTLLFGGGGYTALGESEFIDVEGVLNANFGASWRAGAGTFGAMYDWREAASAGFDDRSEVTGFYTIPGGEAGKWQLYATRGLSDGSAEWGAGLSYTQGF